MALTKAEARKLNILDVAYSLDMDMVKQSRDRYYWREHDSLVISTSKNIFSWFSRQIHGDVIELVQTIKNVSYAEAMQFLETGKFEEVQLKEEEKTPFTYFLEKHETYFTNGKKYLNNVRGISSETIDFFLKNKVIALANKLHKDGYKEQVIVFKYLDNEGNILGASQQGITPNKERYEKKGYLKQIMYNSDGTTGFNVTIGEKAERLIFFEAPIDMMSYYDLNKDKLHNVKLVAMEGLKESVVQRHFIEHLGIADGEKHRLSSPNYLDKVMKLITKETTYFDDEKNKSTITLAVDNDKAGRDFIKRLEDKNIKFTVGLPPLLEGKDKSDWNDILISKNKPGGEKILEEIERTQESKKDDYWVVEFNETTGINKSYAGQIVDNNLLDEIKKLDSELEGKGFNKFYFEHIVNGEVEETIRIDVGEGALANKDLFDFLYREIEPKEIGISEEIKKDLDNTRQNKREDFIKGSLQLEAEGSTTPVLDETSTFERSVTSRPTVSSHLLNFNITNSNVSTKKNNYHPINEKELRKLNRYSLQIQQTAKWYLENLADKKIHYLYKDNNNLNNITVEFRKEHFMHLTGIFPLKTGQTAEKTLIDFVNGNGTFDNIMIANNQSTFQKLQVLPELETILEANTFYFNDLSSIDKLNKLDLSKAIQTEDKDLLLLFKQEEENLVPASIMRVKGNLSIELDNIQEKSILGVYSEKEGVIKEISINENYIKDNRKEMLDILQNTRFEKLGEVEKGLVENSNIKYQDKEENIEQAKAEIKSTFFNEAIQKETPAVNKTLQDYIKDNDIKGLNEYLKEGLKDFKNSEVYKQYLDVMSKFHSYSKRNIDLIFRQNPNATLVAGYNNWQTNFGRQVRQGEKGLTIISPNIVKEKDEKGNPILDEKGNEKQRIYYKKATVFDVSQTEGRELPKLAYNIESEVKGYVNLYQAIANNLKEDDIKLQFVNLPEGTNGLFNPQNNTIYIQSNLSEAHAIKTIIHELAHAKLHKNNEAIFGTKEYNLNELEAESIAYIISNHYGIDTKSYTFGYLYSYVNDTKNFEDFNKIIENIHKTSKELINKIDNNLEKIKTKTVQKTPIQEKIELMKNKQSQNIEDRKREVENEKKYQANQRKMI